MLARLLPPGRAAAAAGAAALTAIDYGLAGLDRDRYDDLVDALAGYRAANGDFA